MSDHPEPADLLPASLRRSLPDPAKVRRNHRLGLATLVVGSFAALGLTAIAPTTTIATQDRPDGAYLELVERGFRDETRRAIRRTDARGVVTVVVPTRDVRGVPTELPQVSLARHDGEVFPVHVQQGGDAELVAALERWLADPKAGFTTTRPNRTTMIARQIAFMLALLAGLGACLAWMSWSLLRQIAAAGPQ